MEKNFCSYIDEEGLECRWSGRYLYQGEFYCGHHILRLRANPRMVIDTCPEKIVFHLDRDGQPMCGEGSRMTADKEKVNCGKCLCRIRAQAPGVRNGKLKCHRCKELKSVHLFGPMMKMRNVSSEIFCSRCLAEMKGNAFGDIRAIKQGFIRLNKGFEKEERQIDFRKEAAQHEREALIAARRKRLAAERPRAVSLDSKSKSDIN
jgi:hypothetical protein